MLSSVLNYFRLLLENWIEWLPSFVQLPAGSPNLRRLGNIETVTPSSQTCPAPSFTATKPKREKRKASYAVDNTNKRNYRYHVYTVSFSLGLLPPTTPGIAICIHDRVQESRMGQLPRFSCKNTEGGASSLSSRRALETLQLLHLNHDGRTSSETPEAGKHRRTSGRYP